jgi:O-antigen/teichoic acid export membrane protein
MSAPERPESSIRAGRELARGSAWMIGMRWAIRGVGLVSTIILVRLLAPDDFGVVAMAMVAVAILESFTNTGTDLALLRNTEATREHYDTAWTLEIIQAVLLAAVLFASAPLVGGHFEDARVTEVVRMLSLRALIGGFQNVGVVQFRRDLHFGREFRFGVAKKLATFTVTVAAAFLLHSYWALVIGQIAGKVIEVGISYSMSDYRPRITLSRLGEIWGFSQWLVLARFSRLVNRQFDRWVVGSIAGAATMGYYYVASDFAASPSDEVVLPMSRAAFPVYSRLQDEPVALRQAFHNVLASMTAISFVMGLGMAVVADDFVRVALGAKWLEAIPLMPWLGVFGALYGVAHTLDIFMLATGRERLTALMTAGNALLTVPVLLLAGQSFGIMGIAAAKAALALAFVIALAVAATRRPPVSLQVLWSALWPTLTAALTMAAAVKTLQAVAPVDSPVYGLLRDVAWGAIVYIAATAALWALRGRPDGIEREAVGRVRRFFARRDSSSPG